MAKMELGGNCVERKFNLQLSQTVFFSPPIFQMNEQQHEAQKQTNTADDDVRVAQEWIFAAEYRRRRENEQLGAVELGYRVVWKILE